MNILEYINDTVLVLKSCSPEDLSQVVKGHQDVLANVHRTYIGGGVERRFTYVTNIRVFAISAFSNESVLLSKNAIRLPFTLHLCLIFEKV